MSRIHTLWLAAGVTALAACASTAPTANTAPAAHAAPAAASAATAKPGDLVCEMETPTGSVFAKRVCMTKEERERRAADSLRIGRPSGPGTPSP